MKRPIYKPFNNYIDKIYRAIEKNNLTLLKTVVYLHYKNNYKNYKNMTNTQTQNKVTRHDKIEDFLANLDTEIDVLDYVNIQDIGTSDAYNSIYDIIEDNGGFNIDVIYYADAIEYLKQHDQSLCDSLEIAIEYGYTIENINSELLASLLKSQNVRNEFDDLRDEINTFFEELEEETNESE